MYKRSNERANDTELLFFMVGTSYFTNTGSYNVSSICIIRIDRLANQIRLNWCNQNIVFCSSTERAFIVYWNLIKTWMYGNTAGKCFTESYFNKF